MSHRNSKSTCVRWFKPSLEMLEDRIVPSNAAYVGALTDIKGIVDGASFQGSNAYFDSLKDAIKFNNTPIILNTVLPLVLDGLNFIQEANQMIAAVNLYSVLLKAGEGANFLTLYTGPIGTTTGPDGTPGFKYPENPSDPGYSDYIQSSTYFESQLKQYQTELSKFQQYIGTVEEWIMQALINFDTHGATLLPVPVPQIGPGPTSLSDGIVAENISPAPASASVVGGPLTETDTVKTWAVTL